MRIAEPWISTPCLTILLLLGIPAPGVCQVSGWELIGPEGGVISAVAQDVSDADIVYVAADSYPCAIFKTTSRGEQWERVSTIYGYVNAMVTSPADPSSIFLLTYSNVLQSTDGGTSWVTFPGPGGSGRSYYMYDLAIDHSDAQIFHVAAESWDGSTWKMNYLRSTTGGVTWEVRELLTETSTGMAVAVDPLDPQTVYVGGYAVIGDTYLGRLMKSGNGGETFTDVTGAIVGYVYAICTDSTQAGRVFVGTYAGSFKSANSGSTWKQTYIPTPYCFLVNPSNPQEVYAGTAIGVVRSTTGGDSWRDASTGIQGSGTGGLVLDPDSPGDLIFANTTGTYRTTDAGAHWTGCTRGMLAARISALRCAPASPTELYAAFYGNAVYKTLGATSPEVLWERLPQFYDCHNLEDICILPADPNVIYAMEGGG